MALNPQTKTPAATPVAKQPLRPQTKTPYVAPLVVHPPHSTRVAGAKPPVTKGNATTFDPRNPSTWGAGMNSAQLSAIVRTQIADSVNPQVTGMTQQQTTYDNQQKANQESLTAYYKALAGALGGESGAVSNAYNSAAGTIGDVGKGLTGDAGNAMEAENANTQAILARGGQTQAAGYGTQMSNPGSAALNPFYSEHALSPAEGLAGVGAARATDAAAQPRIWATRGADALTSAIQQAVQGDSQFQQKIADIYTQVPALRDKILTTVQNFEIQQRQLKDTETSLGIKNQATQVDTQTKLQTLKLKQQTLTADVAKWNAQLQNSALDRQTRLQIAAQSRAAQKELVTLRGQTAVEVAKEKKAAGVGTGAAAKGADYQTQTVAMGKQAKYIALHPLTKGQKDLLGNPVAGAAGKATYGSPQAIVNQLFSYYRDYLKTVPVGKQASARKQVKSAVLNAMRAAGLPLPTGP